MLPIHEAFLALKKTLTEQTKARIDANAELINVAVFHKDLREQQRRTDAALLKAAQSPAQKVTTGVLSSLSRTSLAKTFGFSEIEDPQVAIDQAATRIEALAAADLLRAQTENAQHLSTLILECHFPLFANIAKMESLLYTAEDAKVHAEVAVDEETLHQRQSTGSDLFNAFAASDKMDLAIKEKATAKEVRQSFLDNVQAYLDDLIATMRTLGSTLPPTMDLVIASFTVAADQLERNSVGAFIREVKATRPVAHTSRTVAIARLALIHQLADLADQQEALQTRRRALNPQETLGLATIKNKISELKLESQRLDRVQYSQSSMPTARLTPAIVEELRKAEQRQRYGAQSAPLLRVDVTTSSVVPQVVDDTTENDDFLLVTGGAPSNAANTDNDNIEADRRSRSESPHQ